MRQAEAPGTPDRTADRLYDVGFFLVEAFAALEVTAVIVANARITEGLHLREELSSWILNSYLYPLFAAMVAALLLSGWIARRLPPLAFFLAGLLLFAGGNVLCAAAATAPAFFAGRAVMGLGAAGAFAGQLWTLSTFHRHRLTRPLVWGEVGAALGVVAGPVVGGCFAQVSAQGWRGFFLLNAALGLATAVFAWGSLRGRALPEAPADGAPEAGTSGRRLTLVMTVWQVAVSILVVGAEYLFSDFLQSKCGKPPIFVGLMTVLASLGAIAGSVWAARLSGSLARLPGRATAGLLLALAALAACLASGSFRLAGIPIFASGLCMGLASVSIYACIVHASPASRFLTRSMVYLLGMQIGNALGVQMVGLAELRHLGVVGTALLLAVLPALLASGVLLVPDAPAPVAAG
jgi:predicted MFS family arabinose efflux permease